MRVVLIIATLLAVSACAHRKPPPPVVLTVTETVYEPVPQELLECPLPPVVEPAAIDSEEDYNREFVLELYANNINCFESLRAIQAWNDEINRLNAEPPPEDADTPN